MEAVLEFLVGFFLGWWEALFNAFTAARDVAWQAVLAVFPEAGAYYDSMQPYYDFINHFIDVQVCLGALIAYWSFLSAWVLYRNTKSWLFGVAN